MFAFSTTDDAKKIMAMKSFGGCRQGWKTYLDSKQKHHFELERKYVCIQANAFWKQGTKNAKISLSLQSHIEPKEEDHYFQMAPQTTIMLAGSIRSHWKQ